MNKPQQHESRKHQFDRCIKEQTHILSSLQGQKGETSSCPFSPTFLFLSVSVPLNSNQIEGCCVCPAKTFRQYPEGHEVFKGFQFTEGTLTYQSQLLQITFHVDLTFLHTEQNTVPLSFACKHLVFFFSNEAVTKAKHLVYQNTNLLGDAIKLSIYQQLRSIAFYKRNATLITLTITFRGHQI